MMSNNILEICKNMKRNLLIDLIGCMHKLVKETQHISDDKMCHSEVNKSPHKLVIGVNISK